MKINGKEYPTVNAARASHWCDYRLTRMKVNHHNEVSGDGWKFVRVNDSSSEWEAYIDDPADLSFLLMSIS